MWVLVDYSDCLPYNCSTFTVLKKAATSPCRGDCDCKGGRHNGMFSPVRFPPLLQYSPASWHLLRQGGRIFFPTSQVNSVYYTTILQNSPPLSMFAVPAHYGAFKYNCLLS